VTLIMMSRESHPRGCDISSLVHVRRSMMISLVKGQRVSLRVTSCSGLPGVTGQNIPPAGVYQGIL